MITVWKYTLDEWQTGPFSLNIPLGGRILDLQMQDGSPAIWVLVNTEREKQQRHFLVVGTGHPITDLTTDPKHVGTFQWGFFVGHLFEVFRAAG